MKKDNLVYIQDILNSCDRIITYSEGVDFDSLAEDQMLVDAIIRNIEIIGEAAGKLDELFKAENPQFPVRGAVTMRNKLIHEYNIVDYDVVRQTIKEDIPNLRQLCTALLK